MKVLDLDNFIDEKIKIVPISDKDFNKIPDDLYRYHPKNKKELLSIIKKRIKNEGNECDLNDIDTSKITDMSYLFAKYDSNRNPIKDNANNFNGDISQWDVSNVKDMGWMFWGMKHFNGNISKWDVSNVKNMQGTFSGSKSFNQDLSMWDVSNAIVITYMFNGASSFNQDISRWNVSNVRNSYGIFKGCPIENQPEKQPELKK